MPLTSDVLFAVKHNISELSKIKTNRDFLNLNFKRTIILFEYEKFTKTPVHVYIIQFFFKCQPLFFS